MVWLVRLPVVTFWHLPLLGYLKASPVVTNETADVRWDSWGPADSTSLCGSYPLPLTVLR